MIGGFFLGSTVDAVKRSKAKADKAVALFAEHRARAIADRQAAIAVASAEIAALVNLNADVPPATS